MVQAYQQRIFQNNLPVFDGRKNLYTKEALPIGRDRVGLSLIIFSLYCSRIIFRVVFLRELGDFADRIGSDVAG